MGRQGKSTPPGTQLPEEPDSGSAYAPDSDSARVRRFYQTGEVEAVLLLAGIDSNIAHVRMLGETEIVQRQVADDVVAALLKVRDQVSHGTNIVDDNDPDIYSALHRRLQEMVGGLADVVWIAKSPNDQIATDIRLWLRDAVIDIFGRINELRTALIELGERDLEVIMPGYTHMQPALPILLSHWWLANETRLRRDFARMRDSYLRLNALPLGACQLAGSNKPIDRHLVAKYLGFDLVMDNSLDAVSDRDYLIEFAANSALVGTHLSQMGSEILLWATQEFGFVRLPRSFSFRSLSMPQKRNPELLEILRSRPSVLNGRLAQFLSELKGLPISYSQDAVECLPGLLDVVDNLKFVLELACVLLPKLRFDTVRMMNLASQDMTNSGHAVDYLVEKDFAPDRAAKIVESIITYCKERNKALPDLTLNEWGLFSPAFNEDIYTYVSMETAVDSRNSFGGTGTDQVQQSLKGAAQFLQEDSQYLANLQAKRLNFREFKVSKQNV